MSLITALEERFGKQRVRTLSNPVHPEQSLIFLYLELQVPVTVLMTNGLSEYTMPVSEKWKGREHTEIFFCLPTYWDIDDFTDPNFSWTYDWLYKLEQFVREKETWFGPGHSVPCGTPPAAISGNMQQEYLIFLDPIFTGDALRPLDVDGKTVNFLSIVPIFGDELDYKMGKGTEKIVKKFVQRKIDERLDDYRYSVLRSRMRFW